MLLEILAVGEEGRKGIRDVVDRGGKTDGCEGFWLSGDGVGTPRLRFMSFPFIVRIGPPGETVGLSMMY